MSMLRTYASALCRMEEAEQKSVRQRLIDTLHDEAEADNVLRRARNRVGRASDEQLFRTAMKIHKEQKEGKHIPHSALRKVYKRQQDWRRENDLDLHQPGRKKLEQRIAERLKSNKDISDPRKAAENIGMWMANDAADGHYDHPNKISDADFDRILDEKLKYAKSKTVIFDDWLRK